MKKSNRKDRLGLIRCPYCGSTDVYVHLFETYCGSCEESWPNEIDFSDDDDEENS